MNTKFVLGLSLNVIPVALLIACVHAIHLGMEYTQLGLEKPYMLYLVGLVVPIVWSVLTLLGGVTAVVSGPLKATTWYDAEEPIFSGFSAPWKVIGIVTLVLCALAIIGLIGLVIHAQFN